MLPVTKNVPSGDQARSYISDPLLDLHIVFTRQCSTSSWPSSPKLAVGNSDGVRSRTLPSSPAEARSSPADQVRRRSGANVNHCKPRGHHRTTFTACVCFLSVDKYVTFRSSPFASIFHIYRAGQLEDSITLSHQCIPEHAYHPQQWPACPCHGVRSGRSKWGCCRRARRPGAERPSWLLQVAGSRPGEVGVDKIRR